MAPCTCPLNKITGGQQEEDHIGQFIINLTCYKIPASRIYKYFKCSACRKDQVQSNTVPQPIYKEYLNHPLGLTLSTPGLVLLLFLADKIEMAKPQPRTTSQPQIETQTRNEMKALDDMKEEVEMNDLTPDADPNQNEEVDKLVLRN